MKFLKILQHIFIGFPLILLEGLYKEFGSPSGTTIFVFFMLAVAIVLVLCYAMGVF